MGNLSELKIKIFADGADRDGMLALYSNPLIKGFTTNPTLMHSSGITDYEGFARDIVNTFHDRPISLEVFADDFSEMERQALEISSLGNNVYVKVPITNTQGESSSDVVSRLSEAGVKVNVTAMMTLRQIQEICPYLSKSPSSYISVFAGRIADTGIDPVPIMISALELLNEYPNIELIWASPRELLNIFQANDIGCHIITVSHDILHKVGMIGKNLDEYSLETVNQFYTDALKSGYKI